jgi:hypothetical protein
VRQCAEPEKPVFDDVGIIQLLFIIIDAEGTDIHLLVIAHRSATLQPANSVPPPLTPVGTLRGHRSPSENRTDFCTPRDLFHINPRMSDFLTDVSAAPLVLAIFI